QLPAPVEEQRKLALRMGYVGGMRSAEFGMRNESQSAPTKPAEPSESTPTGSGSLPSDSAIRIPHSALSPQRRSPLDESDPPALDTRDLLVDPLDQFLKDLYDKTALDRTILNHLLHQTFAGADGPAEPESDL